MAENCRAAIDPLRTGNGQFAHPLDRLSPIASPANIVSDSVTREVPMRDNPEIPYVIKADVGRLPDGSVGLRLTFAATEEAYEARDWEEAVYILGPATAQELAANLTYDSGETPLLTSHAPNC